MNRSASRLISFILSAVMAIGLIIPIPTAAADEYPEYNVEITHDDQVTDTFFGHEAKYIIDYQWSGPYSCAYFVGELYSDYFPGLLMYNINSYPGKPKCYMAGHDVEVREIKDAPRPGDIVQDKAYSHVAIIKAVDPTQLTLIEQNWCWTNNEGKVLATVNRKIGLDEYYIYRLYIDGVEQRLPYDKPILETPIVTNITRNGYTVSANTSCEVDLSHMRFGTYPKSKGYAAIKWTQVNVSGKEASASCIVNTSDFGDITDTYVTVVEAVSSTGASTQEIVNTYVDRTAPVIGDISVSDVTAKGFYISCKLSDNVGVTSAKVAAASEKENIDTAYQNPVTISGGSISFYVYTSVHNNEYGDYIVKVTAGDIKGNTASKSVKVNINPASGVTLDKQSITLEEGETAVIKAAMTNSSENKLTDSITWSSSSDSASVVNGTVTAAKMGKAVIKAETSTGKSAECELTVLRNINLVTIAAIPAQIYTGAELTPEINISDGSELVKDKDYSISYSSNTELGKGEITVTGLGSYTGVRTVSFDIVPEAVSELTVSPVTTDSVTLSWEGTDNAEGYYIYRYEIGRSVLIGETTDTSFTDIDVDSASTYSYSVAAFMTRSTDTYTSEMQSVQAVTPPEKVEDISAMRCGTFLSACWNREAGADGYELLLTLNDGSEKTVTTDTPSLISCCFMTGANDCTSVKVRAFTVVDGISYCGEWSRDAVI
ncbi:MAG: hypothetical protein IJ561_01990 [Ruminococcus sp.]|nr:hypothetical protein [Ruminococcus sp.]